MAYQVPPPLPQGAGYGVVVGLGVAFALGIFDSFWKGMTVG
jgi:hypothetical protein